MGVCYALSTRHAQPGLSGLFRARSGRSMVWLEGPLRARRGHRWPPPSLYIGKFVVFFDNHITVASEVSKPRAPEKGGRWGRLFPLRVERDYWQSCRRPSGPLNVVPGVQASPLWAA